MKTKMVCGLAIWILLTESAYGAKGRDKGRAVDDGKQVAILIYDHAQAGPEVLRKSEEVATRIFRRAAVSTSWAICSTNITLPRDGKCRNVVGPLKLLVHVVKSAGSRRLRPNSDVFGIAATGDDGEFGCDAWVFYDLASDVAAQEQLSPSLMLGSLIAHEVGHLLLGANSHSRKGIMCARWSHEQLQAMDCGNLLFLDDEKERVQKAVDARRRASAAETEQVLNSGAGSN